MSFVNTLYASNRLRKSLLVALAIMVTGFAQSQPLRVNDPYAAKQWNLTAINAQRAWDLLATNTRTVRVAVIDDGNTGHPDIRWANDVMGQPLVPQSPGDVSHGGHAIHVAGIIGAIPNNAQGIAGVCKQCEILPVNGLGDSDHKRAEHIELAVQLGAQIINISGEMKDANKMSGNCEYFPETAKAIAQAIEAGVTVVAAAGNHGQEFDITGSPYQLNVRDVTPASCPGVISVGATDQYGYMASYTNVGATLMAPGGSASAVDGAYGAGVECTVTNNFGDIATSTVGILSTWKEQSPACYRYVSGTSMATPHVSGVVGLMLAANPTLTPHQIKSILQNSANASYVPGCASNDCGAGLLNAEKAVSAALRTPGAAPAAYKGVCRFAFDKPCKIDTFSELPNGNISITAYGKMWNFSSSGALIGTPTALTSIPTYTNTNGPCNTTHRDKSGLCTLGTRTVLNYPGIGYLDSISASTKYWNYLASGQLSGAGGDSVYQVKKYTDTLCVGFGAYSPCIFDTRLIVNFPEFGGILESITFNNQYWNFDATGKLLPGVAGNGWLSGVNRYKQICALNKIGSSCQFDTREIKNNRNEVITAYGRYFEFSGETLIKSYDLKKQACPSCISFQ